MADSPTKIEAFLFDIGGVLTSSPFDAFARFETANDVPEDFLRQVNSVNPTTNAWARLERGELDATGFDEAFRAETRAAGHELSGLEILALLQGEPRSAMIDLVVKCAENHRTALLTNNFVPLADGPRIESLARAVEVVDVIVESAVEGCRKPDLKFYEIALDRLGVPAAACVFLDDLGINLKPARALGMTTIKVIDPADAIAQVHRILSGPEWLQSNSSGPLRD